MWLYSFKNLLPNPWSIFLLKHCKLFPRLLFLFLRFFVLSWPLTMHISHRIILSFISIPTANMLMISCFLLLFFLLFLLLLIPLTASKSLFIFPSLSLFVQEYYYMGDAPACDNHDVYCNSDDDSC
uniref:Uncharacterized protein n=1 Tax=Euplotes crassus TaxID=5936 RepID=A0A7S3K8C0_EUPCR